MEERCEFCKFCCTLYTPPTTDSEAKYEYCCTLFVSEGDVMWLGNDISSVCEEFIKK